MTASEKEQVVDAASSENSDAHRIVIEDANEVAEETQAAETSGEEVSAEPEATATVEGAVVEEATTDAEAVEEAGSSLEEELAAAKSEVADRQGKFMRLHAEWDTYRRRTNEQREQEKARAAEKLVTNLLPVLDDFERTIDYASNNGEVGLLSGVEAVHNKLIDVLGKEGVQMLNPKGEAFDALEAQAVATVEDVSVPDETVTEVYQKGYKLGSKVLRPSMVVVSTGGPKREKPETEEA